MKNKFQLNDVVKTPTATGTVRNGISCCTDVENNAITSAVLLDIIYPLIGSITYPIPGTTGIEVKTLIHRVNKHGTSTIPTFTAE